jgi:uncharacterized protein GlcG (DUF336 family)
MRVRAFVVLAFASSLALAQPSGLSPEIADRLMAASGLDGELEQLPMLLKSALDRAAAEEPRLPDAPRVALQSAMAKAFSAAALRSDVRRDLIASLSQEDATEVLGWLTTALGKKATELEGVTLDDARLAERAADFDSLVSGERRQKLERFEQAIGGSESLYHIIANMEIAVARGMAQAKGSDPIAVEQLVRGALEARKAAMMTEMRRQVLASYSLTYGPLADADLERYVAFAETPAARRYHAATVRAVQAAMTAAAERFGWLLAAPAT